MTSIKCSDDVHLLYYLVGAITRNVLLPFMSVLSLLDVLFPDAECVQNSLMTQLPYSCRDKECSDDGSEFMGLEPSLGQTQGCMRHLFKEYIIKKWQEHFARQNLFINYFHVSASMTLYLAYVLWHTYMYHMLHISISPCSDWFTLILLHCCCCHCLIHEFLICWTWEEINYLCHPEATLCLKAWSNIYGVWTVILWEYSTLKMKFRACWLTVLWGQVYLTGCLKTGQHESFSYGSLGVHKREQS